MVLDAEKSGPLFIELDREFPIVDSGCRLPELPQLSTSAQMSAPKFQSFPPSFASFPDLPQPGPTLKADSASPGNPTYKSKDRDKKHKSSSSKDKKRKRERDPDHFSLESDEKLKAEEDAKRQVDLDTPRLFYSDRKGDPLNVRYGGLHSGDVPKYRIVDRMYVCQSHVQQHLMIAKTAGRF